RILKGMSGINGSFNTDLSTAPTIPLSQLGIMPDYLSKYIGAYGTVYIIELISILFAFGILTANNTTQIYIEAHPLRWTNVLVGGVAARVPIVASLTSTSAVF